MVQDIKRDLKEWYLRVCTRTNKAICFDEEGTVLIRHKTMGSARDMCADGEQPMSQTRYKAMRELIDLKEEAGVTEEEETFDDYIRLAHSHMITASNMYYNPVMTERVANIDETSECHKAIDEAIRVLTLAKVFATKVGF
jgi:hypothetical protein